MTGHESCDDNRACDSVEVENLLQSAWTVKKTKKKTGAQLTVIPSSYKVHI